MGNPEMIVPDPMQALQALWAPAGEPGTRGPDHRDRDDRGEWAKVMALARPESDA